MTGQLGLNTPISQAEGLSQAPELYGVQTALMRLPDEYHGNYAVRPSSLLRTQLCLRHWFRKHSR